MTQPHHIVIEEHTDPASTIGPEITWYRARCACEWESKREPVRFLLREHMIRHLIDCRIIGTAPLTDVIHRTPLTSTSTSTST